MSTDKEHQLNKLNDEQVQEFMERYKKYHTPWKRVNKQYRNQLCRCGSKLKTKKCCGLDNKYEY